MAKINDLVNWILQINGVMNYIFVRKDGYTLSHNFKNKDEFTHMITFSGLNCEAVKPLLGLSHFKHMSYTLENNEKLLIFPLGKYLLGIYQNAEAYTPDIVENIERLIDTVTPKKQQG